MGVFKEEAHAIETIARLSGPIFTDAADYGYAFNIQSPDGHATRLIDVVADLKNTSLCKSSVKTKEESKVVIEIAWEIDEGMEFGTRYTICTYRSTGPSRVRKDCNAFFNVNIEPYRKPYRKS
jgi:hypothetical protein